jgi:hypothetical protein
VGLLNTTLDYISESKYLDQPLVKINYYGYLLQVSEDTETHFQNFKQALFEHETDFHPYDIRDSYLLAINYCIRQINQNKEDYLFEILELYQQGLKNRALFEGKNLPPATYKNIVTAGLRNGQLAWTDKFIEDYQESITKNYREHFYTFCKASYFFYAGEFQRTIDMLYQVKINDFFTELGARVLVMKSFYELSEYQLLDSLIDNFRQLINRRKILSYHKTNYTNFSKYLKRLLNFNYHDKKSVEKLRKQIEQEDILTEKTWFLQKVEEWS